MYTGYNALLSSGKVNGSAFGILGFPCNQFGGQEPGANNEILNTLKYVRPGGGFVPAFDLTAGVSVNGVFADAIWAAMRGDCPSTGSVISDGPPLWNPITVTDVIWNFEKVLISKDGKPYRRYNTVVDPATMLPDIQFLLAL